VPPKKNLKLSKNAASPLAGEARSSKTAKKPEKYRLEPYFSKRKFFMNWFLLSIISVITLAISNLLQRLLMRNEKSNVIAYSLVFQLICAVLVGLFSFARGFVMPPLQELWFNFVLITVLYAAGTLFLFRALQDVEASKTAIITSSRALWTIVVALIFLGESFNLVKTIGVILVLGSVVLVSFKREAVQFNKGIFYALSAAFCYGIAFANDTFILRQSDALSYTTLAFLFPGLLILAIRPRILTEMKTLLNISVLSKMVLLGLFYSTSAITIYLSYQWGGTASQLAPISQSVVILTILLATIFLGERSQLTRKFAGATMATIGVLLLR
jgi:transporter family protein